MIPVQFEVVKVSENEYDVLVFSEPAVLKAFPTIYSNTVLIENSKFDNRPMLVVPSFESNFAAKGWVGYWQEAFAAPDKACQTCATVQALFAKIEELRSVGGGDGPQA